VLHLVQKIGATHLLHDARNASLAQRVIQGDVQPVPFAESSTVSDTRSHFPMTLSPEEEANTIAIIFHSSGTTGMPKPIYQTHRVWTTALSCKTGPPAFTTTPLYHGGASDLLRSLMSRSCLYLFTPERPITAQNIVKSVEACPDVHYFLAVPFVLKLLAEDPQARQLLARMDMISVGGAPLHQEMGDQMVKQFGWKLVSRMGSSECGCKFSHLCLVAD
jgi:acyl-coenzyme A synthetase/AMP-(fatty) acid ligase